MGNECDVSERIFGDLRGVQMLKNYISVIEILNFKNNVYCRKYLQKDHDLQRTLGTLLPDL